MKRLVAMVVAAGAAMMTSAMPTKAELQKAQAMVNDVTSADVAALKAKSKTPAEVAAKHMELAAQAGNEAEKYLLLQGAFKLYAKAGDYDAAANVIEKLQAEITDYNPEVTVELCGAEFIRKMRENAPRLYALKENARRIVFYRKQLPIREAAVKKNPKDPQTQRKLAECHAELGDWPKALEVFAKAGGEFKKMSEGETSGKVPVQELGDFWWDYETKSDTPIYKLHAAELYRKALADDSFKGLARTRAEQRVKETVEDGGVLPAVAASAVRNNGGGNGAAAPANISNRTFDLGCERKLEMIACPAGTFTMGEKTVAGDCNEVRKHQVKITRPFWLSKVAVTVAQWEKILNGKIVREADDPRFDCPKGNTPIWDKRNLMNKLNEAYGSELPEGYVFRLPTEAELAYAMTSGGRDKVTEMSIGVLGPSVADKKKFAKDKGFKEDWRWSVVQSKAGLAQPNKWGFLDVINNGEQMVLDRIVPGSKMRKLKCGENESIVNIAYEDVEIDPLCWEEDETGVKILSLCCDQEKFWVRHLHGDRGWIETIRVCLGPDLVAEKMVKEHNGAGTAGAVAVTQIGDSQENKPLSLELAKGINLELMSCPAGEFDMQACGFEHVDGLYPHKVKISRPFWMSKNRITFEQFETFRKTDVLKDKNLKRAIAVLGGTKCPVSRISRTDVDQFCQFLSVKHSSRIPKGYVFRPPTEAEWVYAFRANSEDKNDPHALDGNAYVEFCKVAPADRTGYQLQELRDLFKRNGLEYDEYKLPPKVGTRGVNKWGIQDLNDYGYELMLDVIDIRKDSPNRHCWHLLNAGNASFGYKSYEVDPVRVCGNDGAPRSVTFGRSSQGGLLRLANNVHPVLRICLGPDLIAEKKTKK